MQNTEELLEAIVSIIDEINEMPVMIEQYSNIVKNCERKMCDLLHLIENGTYRSYELVRIASEMKKIRKERRIAKENEELLHIFVSNLGNIQTDGGRTMLKQNLYKDYKGMNSEYRNRYYTNEDIKKIVGGIYE